MFRSASFTVLHDTIDFYLATNLEIFKSFCNFPGERSHHIATQVQDLQVLQGADLERAFVQLVLWSHPSQGTAS